jgi:hypothetical protein
VGKRLEKDFSHPLEMTNKNSEPVISNEERDLSELHHYPPEQFFDRTLANELKAK